MLKIIKHNKSTSYNVILYKEQWVHTVFCMLYIIQGNSLKEESSTYVICLFVNSTVMFVHQTQIQILTKTCLYYA